MLRLTSGPTAAPGVDSPISATGIGFITIRTYTIPRISGDRSISKAVIACTTGIRQKCGFRSTTRSGTTITRATADSIRATTSFWTSSRHDPASPHSADEFKLLPLVNLPVGCSLFITSNESAGGTDGIWNWDSAVRTAAG